LKKISIVFMVIIMITVMTGMASAVSTSGVDSFSIGGATSGMNGQIVAITLNAKNMYAVGTFVLDLRYDQNVMFITSATRSYDLTGNIGGGFPDNTVGLVTIGGTGTPPGGVQGSGTVITINFKVIGNAPTSTSIWINLKQLIDVNGNPVIRSPTVTGRSFTVSTSKTDQTITFGTLPDKKITDPPFVVSATASSGLPVSFSIVTGPAMISGNKVTISGIGTGPVTIRAFQAGDSYYNAAPYVDRTFNVKTVGTPISSITVTSPNGGEKWKHGTNHTIRWKSVGSPGTNVKIELLKGTTAKTIISSVKNSGSYSWKIPSGQLPATNYKIRITSTTNKVYKDTSNKNFTIIT
jgi:hypothetical protein